MSIIDLSSYIAMRGTPVGTCLITVTKNEQFITKTTVLPEENYESILAELNERYPKEIFQYDIIRKDSE